MISGSPSRSLVKFCRRRNENGLLGVCIFPRGALHARIFELEDPQGSMLCRRRGLLLSLLVLAATAVSISGHGAAPGSKPANAPGLRGGKGKARGGGGGGGLASQVAPAGAAAAAKKQENAGKSQVLPKGGAGGKNDGAVKDAVSDLSQKIEAVVIDGGAKKGPDGGKAKGHPSGAGGDVASLVEKILTSSDDERTRTAGELVALVKVQGVGSIETGGVPERLDEALSQTGKSASHGKIGALLVIKSVYDEVGLAAEPYLQGLIGGVISAQGDKGAALKDAAKKALESMVTHMNPASIRIILPKLYECARHEKSEVAEVTMKLFTELANGPVGPSIAKELYDIVPVLSELMWASDDEVIEAATDAMTACTATANNRDLKPFTPDMVNCILNPDTVPECVHKLAATVFVQEIMSPALSVTVPLLARGLNEPDTVIRRKSCTIVDNMCKMIENSEEAVAFMPRILPLVAKAAADIPDPEARSVAERAHKTLKQIEETAIESKQMDTEAVLKALHDSMGEAAFAAAKAMPGWATAETHACRLCSILISNRNFEVADWEGVVAGTLAGFLEGHGASKVAGDLREACFKETRPRDVQEDIEEEGEDLCNIEFSLGYGAMMLLTNTRLHMKRGKRYGLCGHNGCGKSTLMKAIVNGQVEGFPPPDQLKTVYVEHDIQGDDTNLSVEEFVLSRIQGDKDPRVNTQTREDVVKVLASVGFTDEMLAKDVTALSGGWKMKVALSRAMLMKADIYMLDEPTNHLDVDNVKWIENYLNGLTDVTSMIVSHDSGFLDRVTTHIIHFEGNRKLKTYKGNLAEFVKQKPEAKKYYELSDDFVKFTLPKPGFLEGVKSKGKAILKMSNVYFQYPGTASPQVMSMSIQACLSSRVAVIGPNGAGKSTMIKLLTGELKPDKGDVWKHPNMRFAYVAQHAFHHLEKHLDKTPNEYIQWRYAGGEDKEGLVKDGAQLSDEEKAKMKAAQRIQNADGSIEERVVEEILTRRKSKNTYEYEIKWLNCGPDKNSYLERDQLVEMGFEKMVNRFDEREALRLGTSGKALTSREVEKALGNMGLEAEFATHNRIKGLSGGQKVKVVLAAAMWEDPHILVLDEPTNYLDRDSLGALSCAIKDYEGGVIMISHNREFTQALCTETWICERGRLRREGEMFTEDVKIEDPNKLGMNTEPEKTVTDSYGNVVKVDKKKKLTGKDLKKYKKMKEARRKRGEEVSESDGDW